MQNDFLYLTTLYMETERLRGSAEVPDHSGHPLLEDVLKNRSHEQARHVMCALLQDCVECCADLEMSSSPARVLVELAELAKAGDANGPCELGHLSQAEISAFAGWRMGVNISLVCASHIASCDDCRAYFEGTVGDEEKAVQSAIEKMSFEQVVRRVRAATRGSISS